jgi:hypothetical protein
MSVTLFFNDEVVAVVIFLKGKEGSCIREKRGREKRELHSNVRPIKLRNEGRDAFNNMCSSRYCSNKRRRGEKERIGAYVSIWRISTAPRQPSCARQEKQKRVGG